MAEYTFDTVRERDMDMVFAERVLVDPEFVNILVSRAGLTGKIVSLVSAELSKTDASLGESDITLIVDVDGTKYGFLIEDKIDAIAQPAQHSRYVDRGELGKGKDYYDYRIFIFCPEKYYKANDEAQLYENQYFYHEFEEYLESKDDPLSRVQLQTVRQALEKAKKPPQVTLNEDANLFFRQYHEYQQQYYPDLDIRTKDDSNGWWVTCSSNFGNTYITHKIEKGFVDLTFPGMADQINVVLNMATWLREHGYPLVHAEKTGKAASLRIDVPRMIMTNDFRDVANEDLQKCFDAIRALVQISRFLSDGLTAVNQEKG